MLLPCTCSCHSKLAYNYTTEASHNHIVQMHVDIKMQENRLLLLVLLMLATISNLRWHCVRVCSIIHSKNKWHTFHILKLKRLTYSLSMCWQSSAAIRLILSHIQKRRRHCISRKAGGKIPQRQAHFTPSRNTWGYKCSTNPVCSNVYFWHIKAISLNYYWMIYTIPLWPK